ncbi:MAG: methyltransferase domain-containing protein [Pyrinomonadaceae bacterium]
MKVFDGFKQRSKQLERLDTGDYTAAEYAKWQAEMRFINGWLGDARALRLVLADGVQPDTDKNVSVLDVGAGFGELLKTARAVIGTNHGLLVGAELNANAARAIKDRRDAGPLAAVLCDALKPPFAENSFDFVISSLFLHHLTDDQAVTLVGHAARTARKRFVMIDLHRHAAAYYIYKTLGPLFFQRFTVDDGALSIRRSYKPAELLAIAKAAGVKDAVVHRRAFFRLVLSGSKGG